MSNVEISLATRLARAALQFEGAKTLLRSMDTLFYEGYVPLVESGSDSKDFEDILSSLIAKIEQDPSQQLEVENAFARACSIPTIAEHCPLEAVAFVLSRLDGSEIKGETARRLAELPWPQAAARLEDDLRSDVNRFKGDLDGFLHELEDGFIDAQESDSELREFAEALSKQLILFLRGASSLRTTPKG